MNLTIKQEKLWLKKIEVNGEDRILTSIQINGGKNLDGTFKPSGFFKIRLSKEMDELVFEYLKTLGKMPKYLIFDGSGFLTYEEYDGKDGKHKDFVGVVTKAEILGSEAQAEENLKKKLPF